MGGKVGKFFVDVGKTVAKGATTAVGKMIPVVGEPLANAINGLYKKGGRVYKFADGGEVPAGFTAKPINTQAQLISLVNKFPEQAKMAGLTVDEIKEAGSQVAAQKRGGRKKKAMPESVMVMANAHGGRFHNAVNSVF